MHTQQVRLAKPLFFGHQLPPRVVEEARSIIQNHPPDTPYSPQIRNLLATLRTLGHGLDLDQPNNTSSSPYVSVYCPQWSRECDAAELAALERVNLFGGDDSHSAPEEKDAEPTNTVTTDSKEATTTSSNETTKTSSPLHHQSAPLNLQGSIDTTSTTATATTTTTTAAMEEREWFSRLARGEDSTGDNGSPSQVAAAAATGAVSESSTSSPTTTTTPERATVLSSRDSSLGSTTSSRLQRDSSTGSAASSAIMSDQELFSQWSRRQSPREDAARATAGGTDTTTTVTTAASATTNATLSGNSSLSNLPGHETFNPNGSVNFFNSSGTFMNIPQVEDSDDEEVVVSELKKKVGVNEHLNAALASLEAEEAGPGTTMGAATTAVAAIMEDSNDQLAQVPLTADGGRPLSNHELMNGVAPLFGVDDTPLPTEADLGIHETREEQQRSREQRQCQAIIDNCCPQNIFGPLACPNPALHPDDNHSWNSLTAPVTTTKPPSSGIPRTISHERFSNLSAGSNHTDRMQRRHRSLTPPRSLPQKSRGRASRESNMGANKQFSRPRIGWWTSQDAKEEPTKKKKSKSITSTTSSGPKDVLLAHMDSVVDVLEDEGEHEDQDPPIQLPPMEHAAKTPQIATKLEPSPAKLLEQNRPLSQLHPATTLAQTMPFLSDRPPSYRYLQIDTQAVGFPSIGEIEPLFCTMAIYHVETVPLSASPRDSSLAPTPDLARCGKVTETLTFDVVSDAEIEERCRGALWPYQTQKGEDGQFQGSRCGVFPLASNLSIHNLYAILMVHKVVSETNDFDVYVRPQRSNSMNSASSGNSNESKSKGSLDIDQLRSKAEKASSRHGNFIMPFAFGVAPLLQVFGADVPTVPSSRAVQIPLFQFVAGQGDRQIIDHIMLMLYPRADHKASGIDGPAPVTNGGTAMLVMRNFGYLGLHSVVHSKSSLARDRLVDFTREKQLRRRIELDAKETSEEEALKMDWQTGFVAEPTVHGGRSKDKTNGKATEGKGISTSPLYAQELAALRLHPNPSSKPLASSIYKNVRRAASGEDIEPYFHTTFCNELLCHPRLLHNCPKGNILIKVEIREMEWQPEYQAYYAHVPSDGPSVHNPRRGPFLVQAAYSACSARCLDPRFLDEFKIKLPLLLSKQGMGIDRTLSLFFTVYRLSFSSRKKWGKLFRSRRAGKSIDEVAGDLVGEKQTGASSSSSCHLIQLSCGFLPLSQNASAIADGNYDVKMTYTARESKKEAVQKGIIEESSLVVSEIPGIHEKRADGDDAFEDAESVGSSHHIGDTASVTSASESVTMSEMTDGSRSKPKLKANFEPISLQVRETSSCDAIWGLTGWSSCGTYGILTLALLQDSYRHAFFAPFTKRSFNGILWARTATGATFKSRKQIPNTPIGHEQRGHFSRGYFECTRGDPF